MGEGASARAGPNLVPVDHQRTGRITRQIVILSLFVNASAVFCTNVLMHHVFCTNAAMMMADPPEGVGDGQALRCATVVVRWAAVTARPDRFCSSARARRLPRSISAGVSASTGHSHWRRKVMAVAALAAAICARRPRDTAAAEALPRRLTCTRSCRIRNLSTQHQK
jgi:hypothetical protein